MVLTSLLLLLVCLSFMAYAVQLPEHVEEILAPLKVECNYRANGTISGYVPALTSTNGAKIVGSSCFFFRNIHSPALTHGPAQEDCESQGGHLARFVADDVVDAITKPDMMGFVGFPCVNTTPGGWFHLGFKSATPSGTATTYDDLHFMDDNGNLRETLASRNLSAVQFPMSPPATTSKVGALVVPAVAGTPWETVVYEETQGADFFLCEKAAAGQRYKAKVIDQELSNAVVYETITDALYDVRRCAFECLMQYKCLVFDHRQSDGRCRLAEAKSHINVVNPAAGVIVYERIM